MYVESYCIIDLWLLALDLHNCAKILILTIPHAAQASPDIRKGGGSGMKQCTEPVRYPCWRFYRNREEMDIVSNKYEDFNGLTVDREAGEYLYDSHSTCRHFIIFNVLFQGCAILKCILKCIIFYLCLQLPEFVRLNGSVNFNVIPTKVMVIGVYGMYMYHALLNSI